MHRQPLLQLLKAHQPFDQTEAQMLERIQRFVCEQENCFEHFLLEGHVTGSAWIVNQDSTQVLLLHHAKLDRWLQPGGHCDGDGDVLRVALREAKEESGLTSLEVVSTTVFDVDVHWIPERPAAQNHVPGHWHYDVRFLLRADSAAPLSLNEEAKALRWVDLDEVKTWSEQSLRRMALKVP
jgi:8-oxo-dGTP pyrophosphatase MutT (NUDIX family)